MIATSNLINKLDKELEERRQEALKVAEKCIHIFRTDFGATEAFICGSLAGESPWHWHSDIDIAVRGMSKDDVWDAYFKIDVLVPYWIKVDIIPLEFAPSYLVNRILKKEPMSDNKYLALKSRIEDELKPFEATIQTVVDLLKQRDTIPEVALIPALASYVADFYNGCERISERVAVYLDGSIPKTKEWHLDLLKQVAEPGGDNRPPLWSGALLLELDEYRKFRHLERHIYKIELKPEKVIKLAENIEPTFQKIEQSVAVFSQWLEKKAIL